MSRHYETVMQICKNASTAEQIQGLPDWDSDLARMEAILLWEGYEPVLDGVYLATIELANAS